MRIPERGIKEVASPLISSDSAGKKGDFRTLVHSLSAAVDDNPQWAVLPQICVTQDVAQEAGLMPFGCKALGLTPRISP